MLLDVFQVALSSNDLGSAAEQLATSSEPQGVGGPDGTGASFSDAKSWLEEVWLESFVFFLFWLCQLPSHPF